MLQIEGKVDPHELDFLLKYAVAPEISPFTWLSNNGWGGIIALTKMDAFDNLDKDIEGASKRFSFINYSNRHKLRPREIPYCCLSTNRRHVSVTMKTHRWRARGRRRSRLRFNVWNSMRQGTPR